MKKFIASLLVLASSTAAQAFYFNQNAPALICHDELVRIPERGFQVEVFAKSQTRSEVTMKFQAVDLNQGNEVLFEGPVTESFNNSIGAFSADGVTLSVKADAQGLIRGQIAMEQDQKLIMIPVACEKQYQIMVPKALE
ncbi:MAG: hypothetical protein ACLGGX_04175 [Bdellovibrionia bacterium]